MLLQCARPLVRRAVVRSCPSSSAVSRPRTLPRHAALASSRQSISAMATHKPAARTVLGTMTMGWENASEQVDDSKAGELLDAFLDRADSYVEVDTALLYSKGETEKILGRLLAAGGKNRQHAQLAIKANPWWVSPTAPEGTGGLDPSVLREQVETSLKSLGLPSAEILYLHAPDPKTPLEASLAEVDKLHKEGKFKTLGLSNYAAWEVVHAHRLCQQNGWVVPTVYQGMYNAITRQVELELLPALRALGIRFLVYNPLAGGLLTGKHVELDNVPKGRFKDNKMYTDRFWKSKFFDAVGEIRSACDAEGITMVAASLKWLRLHSQIVTEREDGVILGASSVGHLEANLAACDDESPLPESILKALDHAEEVARPDCPTYFRGCSKYE